MILVTIVLSIVLCILANQVIITVMGITTLAIWLVIGITMATALFIGCVTCCTKRRKRTNHPMVTNHKNK